MKAVAFASLVFHCTCVAGQGCGVCVMHLTGVLALDAAFGLHTWEHLAVDTGLELTKSPVRNCYLWSVLTVICGFACVASGKPCQVCVCVNIGLPRHLCFCIPADNCHSLTAQTTGSSGQLVHHVAELSVRRVVEAYSKGG
jgi:hypothetical protein